MAFATIDVTKGITGTIPVANGGTGLASGTTGQFLKFTGSTTVASSAVDAGKVLQVVSNRVRTNISTSSSSYVTMNFNVQITPSAATSKVLIIFQSGIGYQDTGGESFYAHYTLYRDSTNLASNTSSGQQGVYFHGLSYNDIFGHANIHHLDSPNSTSQITYTPYFKISNTSCTYNTLLEGEHNITAMEISA
jgi:P2-related tail formation protein